MPTAETRSFWPHRATPTWSRDGTWILYVALGERARNIWAVTVDGTDERPLTDLRGKRGAIGRTQRPLATDGSYLYFVWQEDLGDIWIADVTQ